MPIVDKQLPLLIQKLLEAHIKKHPPIFPWETKIGEDEKIEPESGQSKSKSSVADDENQGEEKSKK